MNPYCRIDDCDKPVENRDTGLCASHGREARKLEAKKDATKKPKAIKRRTNAQASLLREYQDACASIAANRPAICEGCGRPQGGVIQLSFSHLISRDYCIKYKRLDLYVDPNNIKLHCKDWMGHIGCHTKWESNRLRPQMPTYQVDMDYVKMELPEVYKILKMNEDAV